MVSDEALFERLVGGDLEAFELLYQRYERSLFGFLVNQLRDRAEAEDVFHEAFLALLRERGGPRVNFRAWLFQVARNLCRNRARSRQRAARAIATEARSSPPAGAELDTALVARQAMAALRAALERLPGPLAELYQLRAAGLSYEEIAAVLDVPIGTVKSRMHEMVKRLQKEVEPWTAS
jgi:RNA polymerase sigma-70 factor (ECF subfamily)